LHRISLLLVACNCGQCYLLGKQDTNTVALQCQFSNGIALVNESCHLTTVVFLDENRIKNNKNALVRPSTSGFLENGILCSSIQECLTLVCVAGNIGSELSDTDVGVFISSDGGNSWRQVCFAECRKAWSLLLFFF